MKLIADSGGTKTSWCGISDSGQTEIIPTIGLNPNFVTEETLRDVLSDRVLTEVKTRDIEEIWFYGAGCAGKAMENRIKNAFRLVLPLTRTYVFSDLLGAARGLLGTRKGFVCMIGTGSNSGYYDGQTVLYNVPPLGFILGDEGSGAYMGKRILADFLRGIMPPGLSEKFREIYGTEKEDIVSHVYRGIFPSKFIGGFVQFLNDNIEEDYCKELVKTSFEEFVTRNLRLYKVSGITEIAVTGSVAWNFRVILDEVLRKSGFIIATIARDPIEGLIRFHKMQK